MKRWLLLLMFLACSCGPCCPCGDDCECDGQEYGAMTGPVTAILGGNCYPLNERAAYLAQSRSLFAWSPSGKPYYEAACVVKSSDGKCGSGVYIDFAGMVGVLTCQHVIGNDMSATFSDGQTLSGEARTDKYGHDIGWIAVKHPSIRPLKLSAAAPKAGERVEFVSRGGPRSQLRHWYGTVQSDGERLQVDANITPGDSGGTILNSFGEVVGVSTDGTRTVTTVDGWVVYGGAGSPGYGPIRKFLQRLHTQFCPDGNCPPNYPPQPRQRPERYGDLYPPDDVPEPPSPRQQPEQPGLDLFPRLPPHPVPDDLIRRIGEIESKLDGLKPITGPAGKDGRDGKDADNQLILASLKAELDGWLEANHEKLRGPRGRDCEPSPTPAAQRHFIVVGDLAASYARKLKEDVAKTQHYFDAIELVAPPPGKNVGTLPALVLYVGSQEAVTYRGTSDVYLQLSRIRRGEFN